MKILDVVESLRDSFRKALSLEPPDERTPNFDHPADEPPHDKEEVDDCDVFDWRPDGPRREGVFRDGASDMEGLDQFEAAFREMDEMMKSMLGGSGFRKFFPDMGGGLPGVEGGQGFPGVEDGSGNDGENASPRDNMLRPEDPGPSQDNGRGSFWFPFSEGFQQPSSHPAPPPLKQDTDSDECVERDGLDGIIRDVEGGQGLTQPWSRGAGKRREPSSFTRWSSSSTQRRHFGDGRVEEKTTRRGAGGETEEVTTRQVAGASHTSTVVVSPDGQTTTTHSVTGLQGDSAAEFEKLWSSSSVPGSGFDGHNSPVLPHHHQPSLFDRLFRFRPGQ